MQDTLLFLRDFSAFLCTSMTIESPAGENADDSANQSTVSIFFKLLKKECHQRSLAFTFCPD
jgi:hypothetical protein